MLTHLRHLAARLRAMLRPAAFDRDLDEELEFHAAVMADDYVRRGLSRAEAERKARLELGAAAQLREEHREVRSLPFLESLWHDIRYGLRSIRRAPSFAATAALTLAVGLGLNGALFTLFNTYVFQPVAARDPESLYELYWKTAQFPKRNFNLAEYEAIRSQLPAFSGVVAHQSVRARLEGRFATGTLVSGNYFTLLGVDALAGRMIGPADTLTPGGDRVIVLGHSAWIRDFGGDRSALGRTVHINGQNFTIVGICTQEFTGFGPTDFFTPASMSSFFMPGRFDARGRDIERFRLVGRLAPGISRERATNDFTVFARNFTASLSQPERAVQAALESRATQHEFHPSNLAPLAPLIFAFVLVLVACCVNVSSMLLGRAIGRQKEIGVRLAIGASRARIVRQLVVEGLVLGILGGLVGFIVTVVASNASQAVLLSTLPVSASTSAPTLPPPQTDLPVALFVFAVATVCVLVFALAPALQATKIELVSALRGEFSRHLRASLLRTLLVSTQITACVILVVVTAILLRSSWAQQRIEVGYQTKGILYPLTVGALAPPEAIRVQQALNLDPTVQSVSTLLRPPLSDGRKLSVLPAGSDASLEAGYNLVSPTYFPMLGLPILRGRAFTAEEARSEVSVTIISQATARLFWPGQDPIGKTIRLTPAAPSPALPKFQQALVVGVTKDIVSGLLYQGIDPTMLYFPTSLEARGSLTQLVRFKPGPGSQQAALENLLASALPGRPIVAVSLDDAFALSVYPFRAASWIASLLGVIALLLTASAIYGIMGYVVSQRTREVGIRMALGATSTDVARFFLRYCLRLAAIGLIAGIAVSFGLSTILGTMVTMIDTFDPIAYAAGMIVVLVTGTAAAYIPIRRVARVQSVDAIRQE